MSASARSSTPTPKAKPLPSKESEESKKQTQDKESAQDKKAPEKVDADQEYFAVVLIVVVLLIAGYFVVLIAVSVLQKLGYMDHLIEARHNCVVVGPTPDLSSHSMAYSYGFKIVNIVLVPVYYSGMVVHSVFHPVLLLKELLFSVPMIAQFYNSIVSALTESMVGALRWLLSFIPVRYILDKMLGPVIGMSLLMPIVLAISFWETHKEQIVSIGSLCTFIIAFMVRTYGLQATLTTIELAVASPIQLGSGMLAALPANLSYWWALATLRIVC